MIGKGVLGRRFGGLLDYIADGRRSGAVGYITHPSHEIGGVYYANLASNTPEGAAREMELVSRRSIRVRKPVFQLIVSLHPDESHRTAQDLLSATRKVVAKLGLAQHQAVYAVHLERHHKHCHVAINRVGPHGKAWDMWRSAERIRSVCREVEREVGFIPHEVFQARVDAERKSHDRALSMAPHQWTPRQMRIYERTGIPPKTVGQALRKTDRLSIAEKIRPTVTAAIQRANSWADANRIFSTHGLSLVLYENNSRRGLQIRMKEGATIAASAVDRSFSLAKMEARWGKYNLIRDRLPLPTVMPPQVWAAQARLYPHYQEQIQAKLAERSKLLKETRESEKAELVALGVQLAARLQRLQMPPTITAAMKPFAVAQHDAAVNAVRETYRGKRDEIRKKTAIRTWLDFVRKKAKTLVQDAITVLSWLCRHLDRRPHENRLVASNAVHTPPEPFEHLGFKAAVTDHGTIEYEDQLCRPAFADRGDDIVVYTNDEGKPEWRHMGAALQHGDAKWGGCSSHGNLVFRDYALYVAGFLRTQLAERFADLGDRKRSDLKVVEKEQSGKAFVAISLIRDKGRKR